MIGVEVLQKFPPWMLKGVQMDEYQVVHCVLGQSQLMGDTIEHSSFDSAWTHFLNLFIDLTRQWERTRNGAEPAQRYKVYFRLEAANASEREHSIGKCDTPGECRHDMAQTRLRLREKRMRVIAFDLWILSTPPVSGS